MLNILASAALTALLMLPTAVAPAQDWEEQVADQIETIRQALGADYEYAADLLIGEIEPGDSDGFQMDVSGNSEYMIVGVCDIDCGDLDLVIYDPDEDQVAMDVESDDAPVLFFQGEGEYWVEVVMANCEADTCLYAVQVFERQR